MEIPPRISGTALQEHSSPTTPSPASKQEPSPSWGQATGPPHTLALFDPKGNEQIRELLPKPHQMQQGCWKDRGAYPKQHPTTPEQPCPAPLPHPWASMEKEQKKPTPNLTRILEKFFSTPSLHPTERTKRRQQHRSSKA